MPEQLTRKLADVLSTTKFAELPGSAVTDAKRSVLDWLGSALAGSLEPPAKMGRAVVGGLGASNEATMFPGGRSSAAGAALANGIASHILELDDIHKGSTVHAAAPVISAALAVAERERSDGQAFLLAVTLGYDAALRIGEAVNPSHYRFWHPTGTAATFGAAVAAGSLIGLSPSQMLDAMGSAGTQAAGLWEFNADGAMSKHLHPGKAAFNGILAADLAREGFTGATRILEGDRGFFRALCEAPDPSRVTDRLGKLWKISENCYKLHSCCGHTHTAVDMALDVRKNRGWHGREALEQIAGIHIETYGPGFEIVKQRDPKTPYQAKFSIVYCVAVGLLDGIVGLDQFAPHRVSDPSIANLIDLTRVEVAPDLTARYPAAWPVRLTVEFKDGSSMNVASDFPRGNPENPVSTATLEQKFLALIEPRFSTERATKALEAVKGTESCPDMSQFFGDCQFIP